VRSDGIAAQSSAVTTPIDAHPTGRVAIVTGGSCGVGLEITRTLARQGFAVVVSYARDQDAAEAAVGDVLAADGAALAVRADVADHLDVARLFGETGEEFGGVDVVTHAASRAADGGAAFDAEQWTELQSAFVVNQRAAREVRRGGAIVNLSVVDHDPPAWAPCAGSPAAVAVMTRALALELQEIDVTANAVAFRADDPGAPMTVAAVVGFLTNRDACSVTGRLIQIGGGIG
jgi:3-oxoacyl-[acyl-carrier protein] reductase